MMLRVEQGKGRKDRHAMLSPVNHSDIGVLLQKMGCKAMPQRVRGHPILFMWVTAPLLERCFRLIDCTESNSFLLSGVQEPFVAISKCSWRTEL
jgi:hypothetical protein